MESAENSPNFFLIPTSTSEDTTFSPTAVSTIHALEITMPRFLSDSDKEKTRPILLRLNELIKSYAEGNSASNKNELIKSIETEINNILNNIDSYENKQFFVCHFISTIEKHELFSALKEKGRLGIIYNLISKINDVLDKIDRSIRIKNLDKSLLKDIVNIIEKIDQDPCELKKFITICENKISTCSNFRDSDLLTSVKGIHLSILTY